MAFIRGPRTRLREAVLLCLANNANLYALSGGTGNVGELTPELRMFFGPSFGDPSRIQPTQINVWSVPQIYNPGLGGAADRFPVIGITLLRPYIEAPRIGDVENDEDIKDEIVRTLRRGSKDAFGEYNNQGRLVDPDDPDGLSINTALNEVREAAARKLETAAVVSHVLFAAYEMRIDNLEEERV